MNIKKVFIAGGTGFLGYYTAKLFDKKNIKVDTIALPKELDSLDWFPKNIGLSFGNLFEMTDEEIINLLKKDSYDAFIYALGPDDRVLPNAPAIDFFVDKLVNQSARICKCAKDAEIKRCVVLGSYFAHFDKLQNGELGKYHPYIKARTMQEEEVFKLADENFPVMVAELPYIFGTMPERKPLWRESFLDNFNGMKSVFFPAGGGTAVIDVTGVAEAIVAITINGKSKSAYPVGNENMTFKELVTLMMKASKDFRPYKELPAFICALGAKKMVKETLKQGKESGLNAGKLMTQIQNKKFYIDPKPMREELDYKSLGFTGGRDVKESIIETMKACYPERFN